MNARQALPEVAVDRDTHHRIEQFLYREARLLDHERWDDWLALVAEDIHYWMPTMENRRRIDKAGPYGQDRGALFDDNLYDLTRRVTRFKQPSAWAEDPPTRHAHVVSGVEAFEGERAGEYIVHSTFVNYRTRVDHDNYQLVGRREDILRDGSDGLRLARRKIVITQSVLLAKNLNTFL
ncbi:MAG: 3-phenylpropionate dioxygenase [Betaproteobacteria bacterium HGW-Betaproteobacteria-9]|jgi:ethylbenzene dioxygenase beta subunit|nr:MAG: 3-phenylpropionate dioxygenase [Betaproteobacteria bacterium HGW-Betaproteobacteria-9]